MMNMKMKLWVLVLSAGFCFQCGSLTPVALLTCETPSVLKAAELALDKINADRQEGYIFTLNRVHDVQLETNDTSRVAYNLIIDVLETNCHVLSKKSQQACEKYGNCQVRISVDSTGQNVELYNYHCTIHPVPSAVISRTCPDCPINVPLDIPDVLKTADLTLKKFNNVSGLPNFFALLNVTKASSQWVVGPAYFVDFTIQETMCSRETHNLETSECKLMDCEFAHKGHCSGSYVRMPQMPGVDPPIQPARCEIFEPEAARTEKMNHEQEGAHSKDSAKGQDPADQTYKHEHGHLHPHEHHHDSNATHTAQEPRAPRGTVQSLPPASLLPASRAPPSASSCPGKRIHNLHLYDFEI